MKFIQATYLYSQPSGIKFIQIVQLNNLLGPVHTNLNIFEAAFFCTRVDGTLNQHAEQQSRTHSPRPPWSTGGRLWCVRHVLTE